MNQIDPCNNENSVEVLGRVIGSVASSGEVGGVINHKVLTELHMRSMVTDPSACRFPRESRGSCRPQDREGTA